MPFVPDRILQFLSARDVMTNEALFPPNGLVSFVGRIYRGISVLCMLMREHLS